MAGISNPNYVTFLLGTIEEHSPPTAADKTGGVNRGASNSPGIGINTGDYDPKTADWSREERNPVQGQQIGQTAIDINFAIPASAPTDFNDQAVFLQATADVAADAEFPTTTGVFNRTGVTVPSGSWAWGHKPVA